MFMTDVFVFGSNLASRHGKGAAKIAREQYGAKYGVGVGISGQSYAIPTKDEKLNILSLSEINKRVVEFILFTRANPNLEFQVTRIGCGLAGFRDEQIAPMFYLCNFDNTYFDTEWSEYLPWHAQYWGTF